MNVTIHVGDEDAYLVDLIDSKSHRERKSRSSVMLSIFEEYFEKGKCLGEILLDLGVLTRTQLVKAMDSQSRTLADKLLGEILIAEQGVEPDHVQRALNIQRRFRSLAG